MNTFALLAGSMVLTTPAIAADSSQIQIANAASNPGEAGSADYFTGEVRVDSRFQRSDPARIGGAIVSFAAGARTAWHTHPLGQTLIVTAGSGRVQQWQSDIREIRTGDIVWIPPGVKHWHGATANEGMTHVAIAESLDGTSVDWLEQVTDEQYGQ